MCVCAHVCLSPSVCVSRVTHKSDGALMMFLLRSDENDTPDYKTVTVGNLALIPA